MDSEIDNLDKLCNLNGIVLSNSSKTNFNEYRKSLLDWNKRINLISKGDENRIVERHFFESVLLTKLFNTGRISHILDFGSGAGFPGVPIKIIYPKPFVSLLESKQNKSLFLRHLIKKLNLSGINVLHERGENLCRNSQYYGKFDLILSRAVYKLDALINICIHLLNKRPDSSMLFPKGPDYKDEIIRSREKYDDVLLIKKEQLTYKKLDGTAKTLNIVSVKKKQVKT